MSQNKNVDLERINEKYKNAGVSNAVLNFAANNMDMLAKLSDDNFKDNPNAPKSSDS